MAGDGSSSANEILQSAKKVPFARRVGAVVLGPVARALASVGVTANAVTAFSLALAAAGGLSLAFGRFGLATLLVVVASIGDAIDGLLARETKTVSPGGALFDSSVDRYEELFIFGGLAFFFRESAWILSAALLAVGGSFMVSYGSAKAEAFGIAVPQGIMRRADRAIVACLGIALVPIARFLAPRFDLPTWLETAPAVAALVIVGVLANVSAALRLRVIAREANRRAKEGPR
jgi:CDP-diacylglycerol--glycerol-3-phosphate 3-phosphatidyltransferase